MESCKYLFRFVRFKYSDTSGCTYWLVVVLLQEVLVEGELVVLVALLLLTLLVLQEHIEATAGPNIASRRCRVGRCCAGDGLGRRTEQPYDREVTHSMT